MELINETLDDIYCAQEDIRSAITKTSMQHADLAMHSVNELDKVLGILNNLEQRLKKGCDEDNKPKQ